MDKSPYLPLTILIVLLALGALALTHGVDVASVDEAGIRAELPGQVGPWQGAAIYFCQNPQCHKDFTEDQLADVTRCPVCGSPLDTASPIERALLPKDTIIIKKRYTNPAGRVLYAAIVMSGADRASIHRPQLCLVGQGNEITRSRTLSVPTAGGRPAKVMVLDLARRYKSRDGTVHNFQTYYAYWFAGKGRETPYHVARMFWMGWDRIVHSISYRWSYISVSGLRADALPDPLDEAREFVRDLRPKLEINPPS